jgi:hypothetical protein
VFWISRQDFALATQINRSLYATPELPLLLPNPRVQLCTQSCAPDDDENELLAIPPHFAA